MLNHDFYQALLSFTEKSFQLLQKVSTPKTVRRKFKMFGNQGWDWVDEIDFVKFVYMHTDEIFALSEYKHTTNRLGYS